MRRQTDAPKPIRDPASWIASVGKSRAALVWTDHASQFEGIMHPAMDDVLSGKADVASLTEANNQVNQLFGLAGASGASSGHRPGGAPSPCRSRPEGAQFP